MEVEDQGMVVGSGSYAYADELVENYGEMAGYNEEEEEEEEEEELEPSEMVDEAYEEEDDEEMHGGGAGQRNSSGVRSHRPKAVHQCNVCNKIFVSFKGLQQHAIIHTDQKPFECSICSKAFRFKSNLFEHRSVHDNFTPHSCPYCGKTCRLKGNLKKHLKTHVHSKEELDDAWRPFASNRRPPADIPQDAIIVRSAGEPAALFTPPTRPRKRKLGLGDAKQWVEKIRRGELLPSAGIQEKMQHLEDLLHRVEEQGLSPEEFFVEARAMPFECYECPMCKAAFDSRIECSEHFDGEHHNVRNQRPFFCEICIKSFADRKTMEQHESYHARVRRLIADGELEIHEPMILLPEEAHCGQHLVDEAGEAMSGMAIPTAAAVA